VAHAAIVTRAAQKIAEAWPWLRVCSGNPRAITAAGTPIWALASRPVARGRRIATLTSQQEGERHGVVAAEFAQVELGAEQHEEQRYQEALAETEHLAREAFGAADGADDEPGAEAGYEDARPDFLGDEGQRDEGEDGEAQVDRPPPSLALFTHPLHRVQPSQAVGGGEDEQDQRCDDQYPECRVVGTRGVDRQWDCQRGENVGDRDPSHRGQDRGAFEAGLLDDRQRDGGRG